MSDEEFLVRFGDAIDDRIAEILDELLDERKLVRRHPRLPQLLGLTSLVLAALAASILLYASPFTWTIWLATTVICIAAAWTIRTRSNYRGP